MITFSFPEFVRPHHGTHNTSRNFMELSLGPLRETTGMVGGWDALPQVPFSAIKRDGSPKSIVGLRNNLRQRIPAPHHALGL